MASTASSSLVEDAGRAAVLQHRRANRALLDHRAVRREVAEEHGQAAGGVLRVVERPDDVRRARARPRRPRPRSPPATVSADRSIRPAPMRPFMTAWMPPAWSRSWMWCGPAGAILQRCGTLARRSRDLVEVDSAGRPRGDGGQVQHGVGGAAQADVDRQGVAEGGVGQDVARLEVLRPAAPSPGRRPPWRAGCARCTRPGWCRCRAGHADDLGEAVHGVGGEHAGAGAAGGAGAALELP